MIRIGCSCCLTGTIKDKPDCYKSIENEPFKELQKAILILEREGKEL